MGRVRTLASAVIRPWLPQMSLPCTLARLCNFIFSSPPPSRQKVHYCGIKCVALYPAKGVCNAMEQQFTCSWPLCPACSACLCFRAADRVQGFCNQYACTDQTRPLHAPGLLKASENLSFPCLKHCSLLCIVDVNFCPLNCHTMQHLHVKHDRTSISTFADDIKTIV